jgi:hypothetical protein
MSSFKEGAMWHTHSKQDTQQPAITGQRPVNNKGIVYSAQSVLTAVHATVEYFMPPLSNNCTVTEEWCFLRGPCRDVIRKAVSQCVRGLLWYSSCEFLLLIASSLETLRKGEHLPLEAITRRLVESQQAEKN